jgi:effector-binding domain-containing protein
MIKIGDFSRFSQVPVSTLRYYDEVGLLKPASVDRATGYRYYTMEQLPRLNRILALRDLGFALEQIVRLLDDGLSPAHMREILQMKQAEIQQRVREDQERLTRVEWRLRQIDQEGSMSPYEVVLKQTEPSLVAATRGVMPDYQQIGPLFDEVYAYLAKSGERGGVAAALWHDDEYKEHDIDVEVIVPVTRLLPGADRVRVYELPAATVASAIHKGGYQTIGQAYTAIISWIGSNGYAAAGPSREIYLQSRSDGVKNDESLVTEIQFPVVKDQRIESLKSFLAAEMISLLTERVKQAVHFASQEAQVSGEALGTTHLLLGLAREHKSFAAHILSNFDITIDRLREAIKATGGSDTTEHVRRVFEHAADEARQLNHNYIGTEHLLLGLAREEEGRAMAVLEQIGLTPRHVRDRVLQHLRRQEDDNDEN